MKKFSILLALMCAPLISLSCNGGGGAANEAVDQQAEELATDPDYEKEMMGEMGN